MTPERLGKYEVRGTLGRGAMGVVLDGWDPAIGRRVAIKTVRLADAREDEEAAEALERFRREAQAAGRLSHPNVVGIYDMGETDELAYIVMEFIEGRTLKSVLDGAGPLAPPEAAEIMAQILAGLDYSHRRGVIHRDIKPANVMLTAEGQVKLADFGIARIASSTATAVGTVLGTPAYMPPEQFLGEPADARSDIYAAGGTLYHMLAGKRPYEGDLASIMARVLNATTPPAPSALVPTLDGLWDRLVARAMARRPDDRFQTAAAFAEALRAAATSAALNGDGESTVIAAAPKPAAISTQAPPMRAALEPEPRRRRAWIGLAAALAVAGAGLAVWQGRALLGARQQPAPPPAAVEEVHRIGNEPAKPPAQAKPAPPTPPPPAPDPAAIAVRLQPALQALACATARATVSGDAVRVQGLVGERAAAPMRATLASLAPSSEDTVTVVPDVYCGLLDLLRAAHLEPAVPIAVPEAVAGALTSARRYHPAIGPLPAGAWIRVDYFSSDGIVAHLLPTRGGGELVPEKPLFLKPGEILRLGAAPHSQLQPTPPYGTDIIVATASASPAFRTVRQAISESAAAYVAQLAAAIRAATAAHTPVIYGALPLTTRP